ncbi:MAG: TonB-dependent receptor [Bacteroidetes bacterium]|nr:TonB-dependent receptor [Rhodothermia bacterium]MCS7154677.1 TonB-dependent receptor [Bacteroidota bacterium]MCX7906394.1 TonB-dependent receptor [Bacteroidota bacterium]MDW8285576.1 TonB-dependent receptor [Bacteroidota bacterium]
MRSCLLRAGLLGCLLPFSASAQPATVQGRVVDFSTQEGLAGASVLVLGTSVGTATDAQGRFRLPGLRPGTYRLQARMLGYEPAEQTVTLPPGGTVQITFALRERSLEISPVEVTAEIVRDARQTESGVVSLEPRAAKALAGGLEDVLRALQVIPGVIATADFSAQLTVRGGGPDQNLILIDEVEVFNPYRLYGTISMFNPAVVEDITLLTGGFPARYGDRLSSVLAVTQREGVRTAALSGNLNINIANANLVVEGRLPWDGSWLLTTRRTYYDLIVGPIVKAAGLLQGDVAFPNFTDLQSKLVLRPRPGHTLSLLGIFSWDAFDLYTVNRDTSARSSAVRRLEAQDLTRNDVLSLSWTYSPSGRWGMRWISSWYRNGGRSNFGGEFTPRDASRDLQVVVRDTVNTFNFEYDQSFGFTKWSLSARLFRSWGRHFLEAGFGTDWLQNGLTYELRFLNEFSRALFQAVQRLPRGPGAFPERIEQRTTYGRWHAFVQDRVQLGERLYLQPGLRLDYYGLLGRAYLSPRLNASYQLDAQSTLRLAWGLFRQSPGLEKIIDQSVVFDLSNPQALRRLQAETAAHYVLSLERWLDARWVLRLEGYYKALRDLLVQSKTIRPVWRAVRLPDTQDRPNDPAAYRLVQNYEEVLEAIPVNAGRGRAYGVELLLEKRRAGSQDRLNGWLSYAYARAYRERDGYAIPFNYDRRHVANVVLQYRLNRSWELGLTWRYGSGFPYTPAIGYEPLVVSELNAADPSQPPQVRLATNARTGLVRYRPVFGLESQYNSARLPAYHRLDVRAVYRAAWGPSRWELYLDVINLYNRKNVLAYRYRVELDPSRPADPPRLVREATTMFPILPTLGLSVAF